MSQTSNLQEKLQISVDPVNDETGWHDWATAESQRRSGRSPEANWEPQDLDDVDPRRFNKMPPGMQGFRQPSMPFSIGGATDVSHDANAAAYDKGFTKRTFNDGDQESGDHADLFYDEAGGFVTRHNYLDRM